MCCISNGKVVLWMDLQGRGFCVGMVSPRLFCVGEEGGYLEEDGE